MTLQELKASRPDWSDYVGRTEQGSPVQFIDIQNQFIDDLLLMIEAMQDTLNDHETRITALEP